MGREGGENMGCGGRPMEAAGTLTWICVRVRKAWRRNLSLKEMQGRAMVEVGPWTAVSGMPGGKAAGVCWESC